MEITVQGVQKAQRRVENCALMAAHMAWERGGISPNRINGEEIFAGIALGYLRRNEKEQRPTYRITALGRAALSDLGIL